MPAPVVAAREIARRRAAAWCVLCLPGAIALVGLAWRPFGYLAGQVGDDSFYYLQIADNIHAGHGSTLDQVTLTNGYHPLWMLIALVVRACVSGRWVFPLALAVVQVAVATGGLWLLQRSWRRVLGDTVATAAVLAVGSTAFWMFANLMESGVNAAALAGLSWLIVGRAHLVERRAHVPIVAAVLAVLIYARVDNVILVAMILAFAIVGAARSRDRREERVTNTVLAAVGAAALLLPYLAVNLAIFGRALPISGAVKQLIAFLPGAEPSRLIRLWHALAALWWPFQHSRLTYAISATIAAPVAVWLLRTRGPNGERPWLYAGALAGLLLLFAAHGFLLVQEDYWHWLPYAMATFFLIAIAVRTWFGRYAAIVMTLVASVLVVNRGATEYRAIQRANNALRDSSAVLARVAEAAPAATFAGWNAGFTSFSIGGTLTNLDGLVSDTRYVDDYLARYRTIDFVLERKFTFIVDYDQYLGLATPRLQILAGMREADYGRLFEAYDICLPPVPPWGIVVLKRKGAHFAGCAQ